MNKSKVKLFLGIPSTGTRHDAQCYRLRDLEKKYKDTIEFIYHEKCVFRMFHDHARNKICEEFLKSDADVLWFLDSDVVPPDNILDIFNSDWQLAGAPYPVFMTPNGETHQQVVYTVYQKIGTKLGLAAKPRIPSEGIDLVDGIATGCIFIKRAVLEKMQKPYFEFKYNAESRDIAMGEDIDFCNKTSDMGLKFYIDYSMVCKHYKNIDLLDVNNYAIDFANKTMTAYGQRIRSTVAQAMLDKKFRRQGVSPASTLASNVEKTTS